VPAHPNPAFSQSENVKWCNYSKLLRSRFRNPPTLLQQTKLLPAVVNITRMLFQTPFLRAIPHTRSPGKLGDNKICISSRVSYVYRNWLFPFLSNWSKLEDVTHETVQWHNEAGTRGAVERTCPSGLRLHEGRVTLILVRVDGVKILSFVLMSLPLPHPSDTPNLVCRTRSRYPNTRPCQNPAHELGHQSERVGLNSSGFWKFRHL